MVEVPLWPVRAALCMKELRRSFRMLASCMRRSFVMAWIALFSASLIGRGVSLPCCEHIPLVQSLRQFSRRGVWANA
jgi:hypothetical protein